MALAEECEHKAVEFENAEFTSDLGVLSGSGRKKDDKKFAMQRFS